MECPQTLKGVKTGAVFLWSHATTSAKADGEIVMMHKVAWLFIAKIKQHWYFPTAHPVKTMEEKIQFGAWKKDIFWYFLNSFKKVTAALTERKILHSCSSPAWFSLDFKGKISLFIKNLFWLAYRSLRASRVSASCEKPREAKWIRL